MSVSARRANLHLHIPDRKHEVADSPSNLRTFSPGGGTLSPDLQPSTPPSFTQNECSNVTKIGKYLLLAKTDTVQLQSGVTLHSYRAVHTDTQDEFVCKVRD